MFKNQIKEEFKTIYLANKNIDSEITNIKIALHTIEKLGINISDLEKQLDNLGIEFYKLKQLVLDKKEEV